jgi:putative toxin-antitoxin system antitoxin component (TIGR02293 family)
MKENHLVSEAAVAYNATDDKGALFLFNAVKQGIGYTFFHLLADKSPFTINEWTSFLHLSERTMQRYKKEKKTFDSVSSEKILEITMLYKFGIEVFGNKEKFSSWLNRKNVALGNLMPKELFENSFGIDLLKDELQRIEHGVLA